MNERLRDMALGVSRAVREFDYAGFWGRNRREIAIGLGGLVLGFLMKSLFGRSAKQDEAKTPRVRTSDASDWGVHNVSANKALLRRVLKDAPVVEETRVESVEDAEETIVRYVEECLMCRQKRERGELEDEIEIVEVPPPPPPPAPGLPPSPVVANPLNFKRRSRVEGPPPEGKSTDNSITLADILAGKKTLRRVPKGPSGEADKGDGPQERHFAVLRTVKNVDPKTPPKKQIVLTLSVITDAKKRLKKPAVTPEPVTPKQTEDGTTTTIIVSTTKKGETTTRKIVAQTAGAAESLNLLSVLSTAMHNRRGFIEQTSESPSSDPRGRLFEGENVWDTPGEGSTGSPKSPYKSPDT